MRYKITFMDGTTTKIKASNKTEAKQKAEQEHYKPVQKVRNYGGTDRG